MLNIKDYSSRTKKSASIMGSTKDGNSNRRLTSATSPKIVRRRNTAKKHGRTGGVNNNSSLFGGGKFLNASEIAAFIAN